MSKNAANGDAPRVTKGDAGSTDDGTPQIPKGVVRGAEQLNRGESVSKEELMEGLEQVIDSDE